MRRAELVQDLFHRALERERRDRAAFVADACGDDAALQFEVADLLRAYEAAEGFLPEPGVGEQPGTVIDRYVLREPLGEGGFGVVWRAEQQQPLRRDVALKILKAGMDTRQVVARFQVERQALAWMDHPHIAKVFDAGTTPCARPYFVMELVHGRPITKHCDRRRATLRDRLKLMRQVCLAVEHAHGRGVIHRDLKPNNVLVADGDGTPTPKVIDFGIAKAARGDGIEPSTVPSQLVGTPESMAPEQALRGGVDVDVRADVYGLGVLLYELVTGVPPFRRDPDPLETLRQVREVDVVRPSRRVAELGARARRIAARRGTDVETLLATLRGDVDWIVLRALEKDRERRYCSARALADDIQRHLDDRPVEARPPGFRYRAVKFARRRKRSVAAAIVVLVAIVGGAIAAAVGFRDALTARAEAQAAADLAERRLHRLQRALSSADPHAGHGADYTVAQLLDDMAGQLDRDTLADPAEEASLRLTIGSAYRNLGLIDRAAPHLRRALALTEATGVEDHAVADASWHFGWWLHDTGDYAGAIAPMERALRIALALGAPSRRLAVDAAAALGDLYRHRGDLTTAQQHLDDAEALAADLGPGPDRSLAVVRNVRGMVAAAAGRHDEAEALYRDALAQFEALGAADTPVVAMTKTNLAATLRRMRRFDDAEPLLREAVGHRRKAHGRDHALVARALDAHAVLLADLRRHDEAIAARTEGLAIRRRGDARSEEFLRAIAAFARLLRDAGRMAEADAAFAEAIELAGELPGPAATRVANLQIDHGDVLAALGRGEAARTIWRAAAAALDVPSQPSRRRVALQRLAAAEAATGNGEAGEAGTSADARRSGGR